MKKKICHLYYFVLGLVLVGQIAYTLYQTSLVVAFGYRQKKLQFKQQALVQKKQTLELELAQANALTHVQTIAEAENFELITSPIQLSTQTSLASAQ